MTMTNYGHASASTNPGICVRSHSDSADTKSSSSRPRRASTDFPSRAATRSSATTSQPWDANFQVAEPQQLRNRLRQLRAERLFHHLLRPEAHAEGDHLRPWNPLLLRLDLAGRDPLPQLARRHPQQLHRLADGVDGLRLKEEAADGGAVRHVRLL